MKKSSCNNNKSYTTNPDSFSLSSFYNEIPTGGNILKFAITI
jgi:hypothetical protein